MNSVVGVASLQGLVSPGFEQWWGEKEFFLLPTRSDGSWTTPSLQGFLGIKWPGVGIDPQLLSTLGMSRTLRLIPLCAA